MSGTHHLQDGTGVIVTDERGNALQVAGTTVPTDGAAGYATGCLFQHTDGGDGTALYVNEGTDSSCNFNAVTVAA